MKEFEGRTAVITGAAQGIGRAIAQAAAARGMRLALADRDADGLARAVDELRGQGADAQGVPTDVSVAGDVDSLADAAFARFGHVHLLVNNAGVAFAKAVWDTSEADWQWMMGVNLYGVTHALRAFLPRMMAGGQGGHVTSVASAAGLLSLPSLAAYNASKHAVVTVMEGLHHDLQLRGAAIGCSVVCPSWVKTGIARSDVRAAPAQAEPAPRDAVAERVGAAIARAVDDGIPASQVAQALFDAITSGRFYVLTHAQTMAGVKLRLEDILGERAPTALRI
jgi:NAD(P)-dependent dehydrogenase (short-subunit alcohol dehydrogenase family)